MGLEASKDRLLLGLFNLLLGSHALEAAPKGQMTAWEQRDHDTAAMQHS